MVSEIAPTRASIGLRIAVGLAFLSSAVWATAALILFVSGASHPFRLALSVFSASMATVMIGLARGLLRRQRIAFWVTVVLCAVQLALVAPGVIALRPTSLTLGSVTALLLVAVLANRRSMQT